MKKLWSAAKVTIVFFFATLFILLVIESIKHSGDFSKINPADLVLISWVVSVLIFALQIIIDNFSSELSEKSDELSKAIFELPNKVQKITKDEVSEIKDENERFRNQLAIGVIEHDKHHYRALTYKKEFGALYNGYGDEKDNARNVLFSNKTINLIFREVRDIEPNNQDLLHNIGKRASERFADEMVSEINQKMSQDMSKNELIYWINEWIKFDSDAGFGKFDLGDSGKNWKNEKIIFLKHSFLTADCKGEDKQKNKGLCRFMSGYLEGVLNAFPQEILEPYDLKQKRILVSHNVDSDQECICAGRSPYKGCVFHIN